MSLDPTYKEEIVNSIPTGEPSSMQAAYDKLRTLELAKQWSRRSKHHREITKFSDSTRSTDRPRSRASVFTAAKSASKDDSLESWGKAKYGEAFLYRTADRCFKCSQKGWSDPGHPC